jgi:hypothetical protein
MKRIDSSTRPRRVSPEDSRGARDVAVLPEKNESVK